MWRGVAGGAESPWDVPRGLSGLLGFPDRGPSGDTVLEEVLEAVAVSEAAGALVTVEGRPVELVVRVGGGSLEGDGRA